MLVFAPVTGCRMRTDSTKNGKGHNADLTAATQASGRIVVPYVGVRSHVGAEERTVADTSTSAAAGRPSR